MENLNEKLQNFIAKSSDEERIAIIKESDFFIHSQAAEVLKKLSYLQNYPTSHRMPNMLLLGDSNNGKTSILLKHLSLNPTYISELTSEVIIPVIFVESPNEPNERKFFKNILNSLNAPYEVQVGNDVLQNRAVNRIIKNKVKLVMIDEIHNVLVGTMNKQRSFLNLIKYLSNTLRISFVCTGTIAAQNALSTDPQLMNRFHPYKLKKWQGDEEYLRLLATFEQIFPLKKQSNLTENKIASKVLQLSEGLLGEISEILKQSAIFSIESGNEKIDINIIEEIIKKEIYVPASHRKRQAYIE
jgi:hypothetical protein